MWLPDRGLAQVASWRIAAALSRHHPGINVDQAAGPGGVEYDIMEISGTGSAGPFRLLLNRSGTISGALGAQRGGSTHFTFGWDEALRQGEDDEVPLERTVARIERGLGLVRDESQESTHRAIPVDAMAAVVSLHVGSGGRVETYTEWVHFDDDIINPPVLARFPGMAADVIATQLSSTVAADRVWVVVLDGRPELAMHLPGALAWVAGRTGPIDLYSVALKVGNRNNDAASTAVWLLGPQPDRDEMLLTEWPRPMAPETASETASGTVWTIGSTPTASTTEPDPAPQGELGMGVVEAVDDPTERFVVVEGALDYDESSWDRTEGPWVTQLVRLDAPEQEFRSNRPPVPGPDATDPREGLRFHRGDRAYTFRWFRDEDAAWISRFDIGLTKYDLRELVPLLHALKDDLDLPDRLPWPGFEEARAEAEELVAMVATGGNIVFALHYLLLDGRRVVSPQFREDGEWTDSIPYTTPLWQAEARRVIVEGLANPDRANLMEDESPTNDPFMLMGVADYLEIHPTMARAFMELFDRGNPIPATLARLAAGYADDLVRPGKGQLWESEQLRSRPDAESSRASMRSDELRRRTEPMRRIDLLLVLYDISVELTTHF